jgi:N-acetylmuramoyl-L-alanine amidase
MEKTVTLEIALQVGPILAAAGIKVVYTRQSDTVPWPANVNQDLDARCKIANASGADLFVAIHLNSGTDGHGTETYCLALGGNGQKAATLTQASLVKTLGLTDRGVKTADYYVLKYTTMSAILAEVCFISWPAEEALARQAAFVTRAAQAIAGGILSYLGASPQPQVTPGINVRGKFVPGQMVTGSDGQGHLTAQVAPILQALGVPYTWDAAAQTVTVT